MLTLEYLKSILRYCPKTGKWTWLKTKNSRAKAGSEAGRVYTIRYGYKRRLIGLDGKRYVAARLAVFYMTGTWPTHVVNHKNNNSTDDRWDNLRTATYLQNNHNTKCPSTNTTGFKGVNKRENVKLKKPYRATIRINGIAKHLGYFHTSEEAHEAYTKAARRSFGKFARSK